MWKTTNDNIDVNLVRQLIRTKTTNRTKENNEPAQQNCPRIPVNLQGKLSIEYENSQWSEIERKNQVTNGCFNNVQG